MGKHFHQRPNRSFGTNSDEMPGRDADRRSKLVHQQGMVAQVEYRNTGGHDYTGLFDTGAKHAIIRLSDADLYLEDKPGQPVGSHSQPSIAVKFLRDGMISASYLGMVSFEDGGTGHDFFSKPFMNHLPQFEGDCGPYSIARFHESGARFASQMGTNRLAAAGEDGREVGESRLSFPWHLKFVP